VCHHCGAAINPQGVDFFYAKVKIPSRVENCRDKVEEHPFHRTCYAEHFGWMCVVCDQPLPTVADPSRGNNAIKVEYLKHPFFDRDRMCSHHASKSTNSCNGVVASEGSSNRTTMSEETMGEVRRCAGCHRFEPKRSSAKCFIDVGDGDTGRCVCLACCRTVVTTSDDVIPLWDKVLDFFEGPLGLITSEDSHQGGVTRRELKSIPILIVGKNALNDNMKKQPESDHSGSKLMTRGLCLSERCRGERDNGKDGVGVTAIICLSGLPADLTASILAHEATHAYMKLHPNFPYKDPLPLKVEEGLAQLIAFLFLTDLDSVEESHRDVEEDKSLPSDAKLRQYYRFCIETDKGLYGEGFRMAARAYAKIGLQELLYYVALNRDFPPL